MYDQSTLIKFEKEPIGRNSVYIYIYIYIYITSYIEIVIVLGGCAKLQ